VRKAALFWFGLVVTALVALGLVVLSSASEANGIRLHGDAYYFMKRQGMYLVAGVLVAVGIASFDYHKWRDYQVLSWLFYFATIAALIAVFGFKAVNGSHRWIALGPIRIQPGEIAKLVTVIVVAVWLDKAGWRVELFGRGAIWPGAIIGCVAGLVLLEPDFGSVMVIGAAGFLVMLVAGVRLPHMLPFVGLGVGVFA
jgi:cell division protein FtsW